MKLYFRLLSFCQPLGKRVFPYIVFTLLYILFGLINFTLLIPLLKVLFGTVSDKEISDMLIKPEFQLKLQYFIDMFNYYFATVIVEYGKSGALKFVCASLIGSVLLSNFFRYLSEIQVQELKAQTSYNMRNKVYEKFLALPISYYSNERKGNLMAKANADVSTIQGAITSTLSVIFKEPMTIIIYFIALFILSVKLTLFSILVIPLSGILISSIVKKLRRQATEVLRSGGRIFSILDETISGIRIIKGFNAESYQWKKFSDENKLNTALNKRINLRKALASPFSEFSGVLIVSIILLYGGSMVLNNEAGALSSENFIAYIALFSQVLRPAKAISTAYSEIHKGLAAGERVTGLLDEPIDIKDATQARKLNKFEKAIAFNNIYFRYNKDYVLKNISFSVPFGNMVALVGPSGGGKSTIADLIPRFYDPTHGEVLIDDVNIKEYELHSLRQSIGIVTQESILFNDTIKNNIKFGKQEATFEEIEYAARVANAHDFIMGTDEGYDTYIGDRGVKLSGGQRQRLSIARAVLKNPPILILDEATSSLDTESEKLVQEALFKLMENRTSLVIAHRLSTIQNADKIIVIEEGGIIESGTHYELIQMNNGLYKKLNLMQST